MQAAALSASWEEGRLVLLRMGRELTTLQRRTLDLIAAFFESQQAQQAFAPGESQPRGIVHAGLVVRARA